MSEIYGLNIVAKAAIPEGWYILTGRSVWLRGCWQIVAVRPDGKLETIIVPAAQEPTHE